MLKKKQQQQQPIRTKVNIIINQWEWQPAWSARKCKWLRWDWFLVLHLIGWDGGASFVDQSRNKVNQNQSNPESLLILNWKLLYVWGLIFSI